MTCPSEVPRVYCDLPGPVPTSAPYLTQPDPYSGDLPGAECMTSHNPDEICRWAIRHRVADCGYPKHPGWTWDPTGTRWVLNPRPVTAADLSEVPAPLARSEPAPPWETQP